MFLAGIINLDKFSKLVQTVADSNPLLAVRCVLEGRILSTEGRKIVQRKLLSMSKSENWLDRLKAAEFLGLLGDESVVPMLSHLLDDPASDVRWQAASALRNISGPDTEAALIKALQDPEWATRARAAEALGRMKANSAIPHLRPLFVSDMPRERSDATYALVLMKINAQTEGISDLMLDDDPRVSTAAALAIDVSNSSDPINTISSHIQSENPYIREKAAYLLTRLHSVGSIPLISNLLKDPDSNVTVIAIQSLAELNAVEYIHDIVSFFNHQVPFVRAIAAFSCQLFGSKFVVPSLLTLVHDPDSEVRFATVRTLGALGVSNENVINEIIPLLKDPAPKVRLHATITLGVLGTADVIQHLEFAKLDSSFEVRDAADASITAIQIRARAMAA